MSDWISVNEITARAGISRPTFNKILAKGQGPKHSKLPSGRVKIKRENGETWLQLLDQTDRVIRGLLKWK